MSNLERFDESFNDGTTTLFFPEVVVTDSRGGTSSTYPGPGVPVSASVQPGRDRYFDDQGVIRFTMIYMVQLLDDPSGLNGGLGVRRGDAFRWSGEDSLIVATADANRVGSVWEVTCLTGQ